MRHRHPILGLGIPELDELRSAAQQLQALLATGTYDLRLAAVERLREIASRIPAGSIPVPTDGLVPLDVGIDDLPTTAGVYLFTSPERQYVGLTENVRIRFYHPAYGHLTSGNTSRSRLVLAQDGWRAYLLETYSVAESRAEDLNNHLSEDEIFWFFLLSALPNYSLTNQESNIGATPQHRGYPTLSYCFESEEYALFQSIGSAYRATGTNSGNVLRHLLRARTSKYGTVRTLKSVPGVEPPRNYAFRFATEIETRLLGATWAYADLLDAISSSESDCDLEYQSGMSSDRSSLLHWNQGPFAGVVANRLSQYRRGAYDLDGPQSEYIGVSWHSQQNCWQVRAKMGPQYTDLWQPTRPGASELEAAVYREREIVRNGWQEYNLPGRNGYPSNAARLNELLPADDQLPLW